MKKIAFIFMILIGSLAFTNCSSDDGDNNGGTDCFNCELLDATLCYTEGDDFYTITVEGQSGDVPLEGLSWEEIKSEMQDFCAGTGL